MPIGCKVPLAKNRIENGILGRQKHPSSELRIAKN
jgi:hypothetical protein